MIVLVFMVALCSILYELLLAQILSTTLGNSFLRYSTTIGIYLAALGCGSILCGWVRAKDRIRCLITIEILLSIIGASAPFIIVFFTQHIENTVWLYISTHFFILLIGVLSGLELPLFMFLQEKRQNQILVTDYIATFTGTILFPLFMLPQFGIATMGIIIGIVNIAVAVYLCKQFSLKKPLCISIGILCVFFTSLVHTHDGYSIAEQAIRCLYHF